MVFQISILRRSGAEDLDVVVAVGLLIGDACVVHLVLLSLLGRRGRLAVGGAVGSRERTHGRLGAQVADEPAIHEIDDLDGARILGEAPENPGAWNGEHRRNVRPLIPALRAKDAVGLLSVKGR